MTRLDNLRCVWAVVWLLAALSWPVAPVAFADDSPAPPDDAGAAAPIAPQKTPDNPAPTPRGLFPAQPPPADKSGFLQEMGRWWDESKAKFDAEMKEAKQ